MAATPRRVLLMISSMRSGGSERQVLLLLRHLDRHQFTPHLYLTERAGELLDELPDDVTIHPCGVGSTPGGLYIPGDIFRRQVNELSGLLQREAIDVIYDRSFQMSLVAAPAALRHGIPRVSTIVSPPERAVPHLVKRFRWAKKQRLKQAYRQASAVVAVSQQAAESACRYYALAAESVTVIPNPVDRDLIGGSACSQVVPHDDRLTLVCVGRMTREKGHSDLIAALERLDHRWPADAKPLRVWLIGDGPLRGQLQSQWQARPHRHSLEFLGVKPSPAPWINAADALVLPSHFEGMPNVVLEAMALKTPVIATYAGGTLELQRDRPTICWAQPQHPDSLAQAILQFSQEPFAERGQRIANAEALVAEHHDIKRTTRRIEALLSRPATPLAGQNGRMVR